MSTASGSQYQDRRHRPMTAQEAMKQAWIAWLVMLVIPFVLFVIVIWYLSWIHSNPDNNNMVAQVWFIIATAYMVLVVPAALFWRSHIFRAYWQGQTVAPRDYVHGMVSVWLALEIGGVFALVGCIVSGNLMPTLLPGLIAFLFYILLWPNGRAMTSTTGGSDDHALYSEPR